MVNTAVIRDRAQVQPRIAFVVIVGQQSFIRKSAGFEIWITEEAVTATYGYTLIY